MRASCSRGQDARTTNIKSFNLFLHDSLEAIANVENVEPQMLMERGLR
ncbi:MAG: hypothetical protein HWQ37_21825 [Nostoc sp. NMS4]|nr:hypothetical protein [Nostoc sp. NMS4]